MTHAQTPTGTPTETDVKTTGPSEGIPGADLKTHKMPGHWLLARLGKRVLRPGGLAMTTNLLNELKLTSKDDIVELAPGLGLTARMMLKKNPTSYTGIERDKQAAAYTATRLPNKKHITVKIGTAEQTGLPDHSASIVIGEAMLSMNSLEHKQEIMNEAYRILRPGGRYAIHELLIVPDNVDGAIKQDIEKTLSAAIHVAARPLTQAEWRECMTKAGFRVETFSQAPMNLLRPSRILADEGLLRTLRFISNVIRDRDARNRVLMMRRTFHKHRAHLKGCSMIGYKD